MKNNVKSSLQQDSSLTISVVDLDGENELTGKFTNLHFLQLNDLFASHDIRVSYSLNKVDGNVILKGSGECKADASCSRCLENFNIVINFVIDRIYDDNPDNVDIGEEILQAVVLEIPLQPLCKKDCKGICQKCGKNKNISKCGCTENFVDPRWNKLKDIYKK